MTRRYKFPGRHSTYRSLYLAALIAVQHDLDPDTLVVSTDGDWRAATSYEINALRRAMLQTKELKQEN